MKNYIFLGFIINMVFINLVLANDVNKQCKIGVKYYYKTGYKSKRVYTLTAKSKTDCYRKMRFYQENSTPKQISKKEVSAIW